MFILKNSEFFLFISVSGLGSAQNTTDEYQEEPQSFKLWEPGSESLRLVLPGEVIVNTAADREINKEAIKSEPLMPCIMCPGVLLDDQVMKSLCKNFFRLHRLK